MCFQKGVVRGYGSVDELNYPQPTAAHDGGTSTPSGQFGRTALTSRSMMRNDHYLILKTLLSLLLESLAMLGPDDGSARRGMYEVSLISFTDYC